MKITVSPADCTTTLDNVPVRLWTGTTDSGIRVTLAVHAVIVDQDSDQKQFERELTVKLEPLHHDPRLDELLAALNRGE